MRSRNSSILLAAESDPAELLRLFGSCDLAVGMRLHSLIFSALNQTPCVAVSYDPKVDQFVERIGSPKPLDIRSLEAESLAASMSEALAGAAEFRGGVQDKLPASWQAKQDAEIAVAAVGVGQFSSNRRGQPGYWPSPEVSSLLARLDRDRFRKCRSEAAKLILEANRKRFEDKWKTEWKAHRTRAGVRPAFEEKRFKPGDFRGGEDEVVGSERAAGLG